MFAIRLKSSAETLFSRIMGIGDLGSGFESIYCLNFYVSSWFTFVREPRLSRSSFGLAENPGTGSKFEQYHYTISLYNSQISSNSHIGSGQWTPNHSLFLFISGRTSKKTYLSPLYEIFRLENRVHKLQLSNDHKCFKNLLKQLIIKRKTIIKIKIRFLSFDYVLM